MSTKPVEEKIYKVSFTEKVFAIKYLAFIVSILLYLSGVLAIVLGGKEIFKALKMIFNSELGQHPGILLIESVDTLLFALVILILATGIFKLFVGSENSFKKNPVFSKLHTFKDLKVLLWETLLLALTVWCALGFFAEPDEIKWEQLILPGSIVLLATALKLINNKD